MATDDFKTTDLRGKTETLADAIARWLAQRLGRYPDGGGCRAFWSPKQWRDRGEDYGQKSELVLVHDGGDLAPHCNALYEDARAYRDFAAFLRTLGYYVEQCTGWYSAVYPLDAANVPVKVTERAAASLCADRDGPEIEFPGATGSLSFSDEAWDTALRLFGNLGRVCVWVDGHDYQLVGIDGRGLLVQRWDEAAGDGVGPTFTLLEFERVHVY